MAEYRSIDIDLDIHKLIESERRSFSEPPREALRRLLKLPPSMPPAPNGAPLDRGGGGRSWSGEGVTLPHGTAVRMRYNGRLYEGQIIDGSWVIDRHTFDSPSGAASGVARTKKGGKTRLDGWIYWEAQRPGEARWVPISSLRPDAAVTLEELGL